MLRHAVYFQTVVRNASRLAGATALYSDPCEIPADKMDLFANLIRDVLLPLLNKDVVIEDYLTLCVAAMEYLAGTIKYIPGLNQTTAQTGHH